MKDEKCPNCGASLGGSCKCEYCGTTFFESPSGAEETVLYADGAKYYTFNTAVTYDDKKLAYDIAGEIFTINELRRMI